MSADLLRDLCALLKDSSDEDRRVLLSEAKSIIDALPLAAELSNKADEGIFTGLLYALGRTEFFKRWTIGVAEKRSLAEYCYRNCELELAVNRYRSALRDRKKQEESSPARVFFESGSTIAYLIGHFAKAVQRVRTERYNELRAISDSSEAPLINRLSGLEVLTNNLIGVTGFAGLLETIEPIQGRLSFTYFGFLPAEREDPQSRERWEREGIRYGNFCNEIASCDRWFCTCSSLSLLGGPLVGSRANCLTKAAIFSGVQRVDHHHSNPFYFLVHLDKLVPLLKGQEFAFSEPQNHCQMVFPLPKVEHVAALGRWLTDQKGLEERRFTRQLREQSSELSVPVVKLKRNNNTLTIPFLDRPWVDWLAARNVQARMNILVGLPSTPGSSRILAQEITCTNQVLHAARAPFRYAIRNPDTADDQNVAHVVCTNP